MSVNKILLGFGFAAATMASAYAATSNNREVDLSISVNLLATIELHDSYGGDVQSLAALAWDGKQFSTWREQVIIETNNRLQGVQVSLVTAPQLNYQTNGTPPPPIPLTVKLNEIPLNTTGVQFSAAALFGAGTPGPGNSMPMPLTIGVAASDTPLAVAAGTWGGQVQISVAQAS